MRFLRQLSRNRAAKRYARELPGELRRAYGASARYTPSQIRGAVTAAGLDQRFIALAYAAYLNAEEYGAVVPRTKDAMSYAEARDLLARYRPHGFDSVGGPGRYDGGNQNGVTPDAGGH